MNNLASMSFHEALSGLMAGDFSRLEPLFQTSPNGSAPQIINWLEEGEFDSNPEGRAEAFTCACFNGCTEVAETFLKKGVVPGGGINTGLNAFHWAANRGHLETVELLIQWRSPLETLNNYGGTVLGCAVWSAVHEPKSDHPQIIEALLKAGANVGAAKYPTGDERVDEILRKYGKD